MELVLLAFGFVIFLIISFILTRKYWLWYFKIDNRLSLMHDQVRLLESIDKKMDTITNQGTDLDPEETPKTIEPDVLGNNPTVTDTISSGNDEEQLPLWTPAVWLLLLAILAILFFLFL